VQNPDRVDVRSGERVWEDDKIITYLSKGMINRHFPAVLNDRPSYLELFKGDRTLTYTIQSQSFRVLLILSYLEGGKDVYQYRYEAP